MPDRLWQWTTAPLGDIRGVIILVHGIGGHSKRHQGLVSWLVDEKEYAVHGYDQYGHGRSPGKRGSLKSPTQLTDDLYHVVADVKKAFAGLPIYLLGHSMGGLVVLDYALAHRQEIDGVIALSPALKANAHVLRLLLPFMLRVMPNVAINNGLPLSGISRNDDVIAAYMNDEWVHDKITPRLAHFILSAAERVNHHAGNWSVPTLLLYAGCDYLVDPQGSEQFASQAPREVVTAQGFKDAYHEIHHEPDTREFYRALAAWLANTNPNP